MVIKTPKDATAPVRTVTLSDAEVDVCEAIGIDIERKPDITFTSLVKGFQKVHKMSLEAAQNAACLTWNKIAPPPAAKTVATYASQQSMVPVMTMRDADAAIAARDTRAPYARRTSLLCKAGMGFENAQVFALALREDVPAEAFNPDREMAWLDEPRRQFYLALSLTLTGIFSAPLGRMREAMLTVISNSNTRESLEAIAAGFIGNNALARQWSLQVLSQIGDAAAMPYESARRLAEEQIEKLVSMATRPGLSPGVVDPAIADRSANRAGPSAGPLTSNGLPLGVSAQAAVTSTYRPVTTRPIGTMPSSAGPYQMPGRTTRSPALEAHINAAHTANALRQAGRR